MRLNEPQNQCRKQYAGAKISKVTFLANEDHNADYFVSGSWNGDVNSIALWSTSEEPSEDPSGIQQISQLKVEADVNDLFVLSQVQFVAGLSNGDVQVIECQSNGSLVTTKTFPAVHNKAASTAVSTGTKKGHAVSVLSEDLMGVTCMIPCAHFQLVSGHTTGQIHLWDVRQAARSSGSAMAILGKIPSVSKAVTTLNDSVTSIASHPAQPNVLAFGTSSGSISFIDIRQPDQDLPNLLKVCQDSVNQLKFHPVYPSNCFSCSDSGLIHWDASNLGDEPMQDSEESCQNGNNIWLSGKMWNNIQLKALVEEDPKLISTFDVAQNSLVVGSNTANLLLLNNLNFY
uniref:Nucleoporin Nup43 n=1 Tax=Ditylenchus dipsaci TaxID=166011 RepID=A0A915D8I8_9BILA